MTPMHVHAGSGGGGGDGILWIFVLPFVVAVGGYLASVLAEHRRGRDWPWMRTLCWMLGCATALLALLGPLATSVFSGFVGHMAAHVLMGMVAPLLLVLGAPITLALRTLDLLTARRLSRILRSTPARVFTMPEVAATINLGSMAVFYLTPLHAIAQVPVFHLVLMGHFLLTGTLFTASLVSIDPNPHRAPIRTRLIVLVLALAAHGVLAKLMYASPLPGIPAAEVEAGAQLMYYAGDIVDLALMALVLGEWYRVSGRRLARRPRMSAETVERGAA
jgi:putative membrane protein